MDTPERTHESLPARQSAVTTSLTPAESFDDYQEAQPAPGKRVSARLLWRAFRRYWWQALLLWAAGSAGLMTLAYYRVKPTYDAVSLVRVEQGDMSLFGKGGGPMDFSEYKETQVALVTNPVVLATALSKHPEIQNFPLLKNSDDPESEIRENLIVKVVPKTNLIQVALSSSSPFESATIVNAVVEAYLQNALATNYSETGQKIERLKETKAEWEDKVKLKRSELQAFQKKLGTADIEDVKGRNGVTLEEYKRYSVQLTEIEIKRISAEGRLNLLRSEKIAPLRSLDPKEIEEAVSEIFYDDPRVVGLLQEQRSAEAKLKRAQKLSRSPHDPSVRIAQERYDEAKQRLDALWAQREPRLRKKVLAGSSDEEAQKEIERAQVEVESLVAQEKAYQDKLTTMNISNQSREGEALLLQFATRDLDRYETLLNSVQNELLQLEFQAKSKVAQLRQEFAAKPSLRPSSANRRKVMAVAPVGMLCVVMALVVLLELHQGRVADPEELGSRIKLQVMGVVPPLPPVRSAPKALSVRGELRAKRQLDEYVQSLDHLRVALSARRDPWGREIRCVLITSACGSEGKTTLAAQLAERCVNAGLMTLLIDADLRNPTLSRMLDAPESLGLINVLRGEATAEQAITVIGDAGGFHFLPSGTPRIDPSRLLEGAALGNLLARARESFDMIIVDAPPVLPVPDALTIGRWTDGALLAVRHDVSRFPLIERANRRLSHVGVPVLGAVVNGVRSMETAYGGYYAYSGADPAAEAESEPSLLGG